MPSGQASKAYKTRFLEEHRYILQAELKTKYIMPAFKPILIMAFALLLSFALNAEPPKAEQAFAPSVRIIDPNTLGIRIQMRNGVYLYQDKTALQADKGVHLGQYSLPNPTAIKTKQGKTLRVYQKELELSIPLFGNGASGNLQLHYQGCALDGFCYPPQSKTIALEFANHGGLTGAAFSMSKPQTSTDGLPELGKRSLWFIGTSFMLFGILLSFTPCVLPMIPVLVGIISGHANISTKKGFSLGLAYTLGIAVSYSLVGAVFAYFGHNLQSVMQSPGIILSFAALFVLLALSSLGVMKITLPASLQAKLAYFNYHLPKNNLLGAFGMGALSTLILSPCVTPPLVGAIGFMVQTGNMHVGAFALFCMGIGIGIPLIILSTTAGRYLPKAGHWMESIRLLVAYILLGVALYLLCKLLSPIQSKMLVGLYIFFAGVLFGGFKRAFNAKQALRHGLALLGVMYGISLMLGASLGEESYRHPLGHVYSADNTLQDNALRVDNMADLNKALLSTREQQRVLFFTADWCLACAEQKRVIEIDKERWAKHNMRFIFVDITKRNQRSEALEVKYQIIAPPTLIVLDNAGKPLKPYYIGDNAVEDLADSI